jgi:hypothetical protein
MFPISWFINSSLLFGNRLILCGLIVLALSLSLFSQTTVSRSVGTKAAYSTGTVTVSGGTTVTLSGGGFDADWGLGDKILIGATTGYVFSRDNSTQMTLQASVANASAQAFTISRAYGSLFAWEAGEQANLVTANQIKQAVCYGDGIKDSQRVDIAGWTTDATHYIRLFTPASERHQGVWNAAYYNLQTPATTADGQYSITCNVSNVRVDGLQISATGTFAYTGSVGAFGWAHSGIQVSNNILRKAGAVTDWSHYVGVYDIYGNDTKIWNNIIYDFKSLDGGSGMGIYYLNGPQGTCYLYNNTLYNCGRGIMGNALVKNCLVQKCPTAGFEGTFNAASSNNLSDLATAPPGTTPYASTTVQFVDSAAENFLLATTDAGAKNRGVDLSTDPNIPFNTDIKGTLRSGAWDIGADEQGVSVSGSVKYVNDNAPGPTYDGTQANPFTTLQAAMDAMPAGTPTTNHIIIVYPGSYAGFTVSNTRNYAANGLYFQGYYPSAKDSLPQITGTGASLVSIDNNYATFQYLRFTAGAASQTLVDVTAQGDSIAFFRCLFDLRAASAGSKAVSLPATGNKFTMENCVILGGLAASTPATGHEGVVLAGSRTGHRMVNNTAIKLTAFVDLSNGTFGGSMFNNLVDSSYYGLYNVGAGSSFGSTYSYFRVNTVNDRCNGAGCPGVGFNNTIINFGVVEWKSTVLSNSDFIKYKGTAAVRNAGTNTGAPPDDFFSIAVRPKEGVDDIGAFEYIPGAPPNNLTRIDSSGTGEAASFIYVDLTLIAPAGGWTAAYDSIRILVKSGSFPTTYNDGVALVAGSLASGSTAFRVGNLNAATAYYVGAFTRNTDGDWSLASAGGQRRIVTMAVPPPASPDSIRLRAARDTGIVVTWAPSLSAGVESTYIALSKVDYVLIFPLSVTGDTVPFKSASAVVNTALLTGPYIKLDSIYYVSVLVKKGPVWSNPVAKRAMDTITLRDSTLPLNVSQFRATARTDQAKWDSLYKSHSNHSNYNTFDLVWMKSMSTDAQQVKVKYRKGPGAGYPSSVNDPQAQTARVYLTDVLTDTLVPAAVESVYFSPADTPWVEYYFGVFVQDRSGLWSLAATGGQDTARSAFLDTLGPVNFLACSAWVASSNQEIGIMVRNLDSIGLASGYDPDSIGIFWDSASLLIDRILVQHLRGRALSPYGRVIDTFNLDSVYIIPQVSVPAGPVAVVVTMKDSLGNWSLVNLGKNETTIVVLPAMDLRPPNNVMGLSVVSADTYSVRLRLVANSLNFGDTLHGTAPYGVFWSAASFVVDSGTALKNYQPKVTSLDTLVTVSNLLPGRKYYFSVSVRDQNDNWAVIDGAPSGSAPETLSVTTIALPPDTVPVPDPYTFSARPGQGLAGCSLVVVSYVQPPLLPEPSAADPVTIGAWISPTGYIQTFDTALAAWQRVSWSNFKDTVRELTPNRAYYVTAGVRDTAGNWNDSAFLPGRLAKHAFICTTGVDSPGTPAPENAGRFISGSLAVGADSIYLPYVIKDTAVSLFGVVPIKLSDFIVLLRVGSSTVPQIADISSPGVFVYRSSMLSGLGTGGILLADTIRSQNGILALQDTAVRLAANSSYALAIYVRSALGIYSKWSLTDSRAAQVFTTGFAPANTVLLSGDSGGTGFRQLQVRVDLGTDPAGLDSVYVLYREVSALDVRDTGLRHNSYQLDSRVHRGLAVKPTQPVFTSLLSDVLGYNRRYLVAAFIKGAGGGWCRASLGSQTVLTTGPDPSDVVPPANPFVLTGAGFPDIHHLQVSWSGFLGTIDPGFEGIALLIDTAAADTLLATPGRAFIVPVDTSLKTVSITGYPPVRAGSLCIVRLYTRDLASNYSAASSAMGNVDSVRNYLSPTLGLQVSGPDSGTLSWVAGAVTDPLVTRVRVIVRNLRTGLSDTVVSPLSGLNGVLGIKPGGVTGNFSDSLQLAVAVGGLAYPGATGYVYSGNRPLLPGVVSPAQVSITGVYQLRDGSGRVHVDFTVLDPNATAMVRVRGEFYDPAGSDCFNCGTGGLNIFGYGGTDVLPGAAAQYAERGFPDLGSYTGTARFRLITEKVGLADTADSAVYLDNAGPDSLQVTSPNYNGTVMSFSLLGTGLDSVRYGTDSAGLWPAPYAAYNPLALYTVMGGKVYFQGRDWMGNSTKVLRYNYLSAMVVIFVPGPGRADTVFNQDLRLQWERSGINYAAAGAMAMLAYQALPAGSAGWGIVYGRPVSMSLVQNDVFDKSGKGLDLSFHYPEADSVAQQMRLYRWDAGTDRVELVSYNSWSGSSVQNWDAGSQWYTVHGLYPDSGEYVYFLGRDTMGPARLSAQGLVGQVNVVAESLVLKFGLEKWSDAWLPVNFRFKYLGEVGVVPRPELRLGAVRFRGSADSGLSVNLVSIGNVAFLEKVKREGLVVEVSVTDGYLESKLEVSVPVLLEGGEVSPSLVFGHWRLFSLPGLLQGASTTIAGVLETLWNPGGTADKPFSYPDLRDSVRVYRYYPKAGVTDYHEYSDQYDPAGYFAVRADDGFRVEPGRAFWMVRETAAGINLAGRVVSSVPFVGKGYVLRRLGQAGGTDIGSPYLFPVCLGDVMEATAGNRDSVAFFGQMKFYRWVADNTAVVAVPMSPVGQFDLGDSLVQYSGYTVLMTDMAGLDSLVVPALNSRSSSYGIVHLVKSRTLPESLGVPGALLPETPGNLQASWYGSISLSAGNTGTGRVYYGLGGWPRSGKVFSYPELRSGGGTGWHLALVAGKRAPYTHLFQDGLSGGGCRWTVTVDYAGAKPGRGVLDFGDLSLIPESLSVYVNDLSANCGQDLRTVSGLDVALAKGESRRFEVLVGNKSYVAKYGLGQAPAVFALSGNVPNPFNPVTTITYGLPVKAGGLLLDGRSRVKLSIYDLAGRRVCVLADHPARGGYYRAIWRGRDTQNRTVASGVYFYRLQVRNNNGEVLFAKTKKMVLIK